MCCKSYESCCVIEKNRVWFFKWDLWDLYHIYGHVKRHTPQPHELLAYLFTGEPWMKCLFMSQHDSSLIRNCIAVATTAASVGNNAKVFEMTPKWRHIVNNYSKFQLNLSPKLGSFSEKKKGRFVISGVKCIHRNASPANRTIFSKVGWSLILYRPFRVYVGEEGWEQLSTIIKCQKYLPILCM